MEKVYDKDKKILEYEDSPSGYVTVYNYKEPFMKFEKGFGFQGMLLLDPVNDKIQCHFCGGWYEALQNHLKKEHAMPSWAYKEEVGLNKKTALINERLRGIFIANGKKNAGTLRPNTIHTQETKDQIRRTVMENRAEEKNQNGTCPLQLIERLQKLYEKLGRTPTRDEITFEESLKKTWGSIEVACQRAGIPYRKPGENIISHKKYTDEFIIQYLYEFLKKNGRFPHGKDFREEGINGLHSVLLKMKKHSPEKFRRLYTQAAIKDGQYPNGIKIPKGRYKKESFKLRYTKEDLLMFLRKFPELHGREPSYSDARRKMIPSAGVYRYYFGSLKNALKMC